MTTFLGCYIDPAESAEVVDRLDRDGYCASFSSAMPNLDGYSKLQINRGVVRVLAQDGEMKVNGSMRTAYRQTTGVCVSRGTGGAILDSYLHALSLGGTVGKPVDIATEPIFGGSRIAIGKGRLGRNDGSYGCWAAEYVSRFGTVSRASYGGIDLTKPDEQLAQRWGLSGVPKAVQDAGLIHLVSAHKVHTPDQLADAIWSGYYAAVCRSTYCSYVDRDGFGVFANQGAHCTEICGVYIDRSHKRRWVEQQSHGGGIPSQSPIAHTADGDVALRDGCYPVRDESIADVFRNDGEIWCFAVKPGNEFRT